MDLSFIKSNKGNDMLVIDGYTFRKDKKVSERQVWRCTDNHHTKCPSRCQTKEGVLVQQPKVHNHQSDKARVEAKKIRNELKAIALTTNEPTVSLLETASKSMSKNNMKNIKNLIRRIRKEHHEAMVMDIDPCFVEENNISNNNDRGSGAISNNYHLNNDVMATYFKHLENFPTITKVIARSSLNNSGLLDYQISVQCLVENTLKVVLNVDARIPYHLINSTATTDLVSINNNSYEDNLKILDKTIAYVNDCLSGLFFNQCPFEQKIIDNILIDHFECLLVEHKAHHTASNGNREDIASLRDTFAVDGGNSEEYSQRQIKPLLDDKQKNKLKNKNKTVNSLTSVTSNAKKSQAHISKTCRAMIDGLWTKYFISEAICRTSGRLLEIPLYKHISNCSLDQPIECFNLPVPIMTMLTRESGSPGKLNCIREFLLIPAPNKSICQVQFAIAKMNHAHDLLTKENTTSQTSISSSLPLTFDSIEAALNLLTAIVERSGCVLGRDYFLGLNCAAQEYYDSERDRYECFAGQWKSSEEMTKFWIDLINSHPSIIMIIDPLSKQHVNDWIALTDSITDRCYVLGSNVYPSADVYLRDCPSFKFQTSGSVVRTDSTCTLTEIVNCFLKMLDCNNIIAFSASEDDTCSTFLCDLSVSIYASFVKLGNVRRTETVRKLNRLREIQEELEMNENHMNNMNQVNSVNHVNSVNNSSSDCFLFQKVIQVGGTNFVGRSDVTNDGEVMRSSLNH